MPLTKKNNRCLLLIGAVLLILSISIGVLCHFLLNVWIKTDYFPKRMVNHDFVLNYFNETDPMKISWFHGANSPVQLKIALTNDRFMMLEADVILRNETATPVMAHPPATDSELTLEEWLDKVLTVSKKGIKLDFKTMEAVGPSLKLLQIKEQLGKIHRPIWLHADIAVGPGSSNTRPIEAKKFFNLINKIYPNVTVSVGWTTNCCSQPFSMKMMEEMWSLIEGLKQPVSISARLSLLKSSWKNFKWIANKSPNISITIWNPFGLTDWENNVMPHDLLYVRNNMRPVLFYDLPDPQFSNFQKLGITAGSPLNFFDLHNRDGLLISWYHAANDKTAMNEAIQSNVMMLEADVILRGQDTPQQTNEPVMAHPPLTDSDNTLKNWLTQVTKTHKGIKLDFKSNQSVMPSMKIIKTMNVQQPIWLNADILRGPNTPDGRFPIDAGYFLQVITDHYPLATLSIGWTTGWTNTPTDTGYDSAMIDEMLVLCANLTLPVTFPIRAVAVKRSWNNLQKLLDASDAYTLTIWTGKTDNLNIDDVIFVRKKKQYTERIFYDLPTRYIL